jgi:hypothetical protein
MRLANTSNMYRIRVKNLHYLNFDILAKRDFMAGGEAGYTPTRIKD